MGSDVVVERFRLDPAVNGNTDEAGALRHANDEINRDIDQANLSSTVLGLNAGEAAVNVRLYLLRFSDFVGQAAIGTVWILVGVDRAQCHATLMLGYLNGDLA